MKGFTLVEGLFTVAIFSLVFVSIFSIMDQGLKTWHITDVSIEVQQDARRALMAMERQLRQTRSSRISAPPADDAYHTSVTFKIPRDVNGDGRIVDVSGNIEWSPDITYSLNASGQIIRTEGSGIMVLGNNVSILKFRRFSSNPDVIQIYIDAKKQTVAGKDSEMIVELTVKVRN